MSSLQVLLFSSKVLKKFLSIILVFTILIYVVMNFIYMNKTYAATQTRESYSSSKLSAYPGFVERIEALKAAHPNWNFTILYTGLDWAQVLKNETVAYHGRNLVSASSPSSWICPECGDTHYDNGSWRCASEAIVAYYMDPRNSLNEDYIFQFEALSYNSESQIIEGVNSILKDVYYMQGNTITYTTTSGTQETINKSYAQVIMEAAQQYNVSPYHIAARIRQEQGTGNSPSALATGTYSGYTGYYNFLNIGATGSGSNAVITNGLNYAVSSGWTDPEKAIKGGVSMIASSYIGVGQDTLYLQKFDVDNSDGKLYYKQYMQNVSASKSEGNEVRKSYADMGFLDNQMSFIIPVYENMPTEASPVPGTETLVTQDVEVKGSSVIVRSGPSKDYSELTRVNTGDILVRIEIASTTSGGYYFDKVVLPDGRKGYIARDYISQVADITNTNDAMVTTTGVYLRNGPGTQDTTTIILLATGQQVTRIETGKYNGLDGYDWDRVVLSDGTKGYIASKYLEMQSSNNGGGQTSTEQIKVICPSGLKVRESPNTSSATLTYLSNGDVVTRTQANVSQSNGFIWDKITMSNGIEGYIARGTTSGTEVYIEVITSNNGGSGEVVTPTEEKNFKLENSNIICEPAVTVEVIKEKYTDMDIVVNKPDGTVITTGNIGTGYSVSIGNTSYIAVKLGDVNGDGIADVIDLALLKRHLIGTYQLTDSYYKAGILQSNVTEIDVIDLALLKRYLIGTSNITV